MTLFYKWNLEDLDLVSPFWYYICDIKCCMPIPRSLFKKMKEFSIYLMQTSEISFIISQGQIVLILNTHICKGSFSWSWTHFSRLYMNEPTKKTELSTHVNISYFNFVFCSVYLWSFVNHYPKSVKKLSFLISKFY